MGRCRQASATSEGAAVAATAVDDNEPGISACGEDPRVVIIEYGPFHRRLRSSVEKVLSDVRKDVGSSSDCDASREAVLYDVLKRKEAIVRIDWIVEASLSVSLRVHFVCKLGGRISVPGKNSWARRLQ